VSPVSARPALEADGSARTGGACTGGRSSDSWALPGLSRRPTGRRFPGAAHLVLNPRIDAWGRLSFPLTAAGQSRIHTGFPLTSDRARWGAT